MTLSCFAIVIFATYTADLTTRMTVGQAANPIKSFKDIYDLGKKLLINRGGAGETFLKNSPDGSYLSLIFNSMQEDQFIERSCKNKCIEDKLQVQNTKHSLN